MNSPLQVWVIGDGKAGHENQSFGLTDALARLTGVRVERLAVPRTLATIRRLREVVRLGAGMAPPDLVVGAGHATHPALLWLARRHRVPSVVLMRPTLPTGLFDLCLAPEHDLTGRRHGSNVIATVGALHRVVPPPTGPRPGGLILVGGPSAQHGFAGGDLLENIRLIVAAGPDLDWRLTDSRRTPPEWLESMAAAGCPVRCFSWRETPPGWVGAGLAVSRDVWVTEDSVSMICEALGAGARVGVLPMPRTKPRSRVVHGIQSLLDRGYANSLAEWRETGGLRPPREILLEADRCARLVLERLFPKRLSGL